ncbi:Peptidase A1 domain-containing protein [Heracleum sosnowskyi]|uniref:Peptidase A1 domain-containing protein n=1 Tax=Heracleum sosnowskyi TaxID=360622 RepID=A0AAD8I6N8_9APIA|nr:Peptidase A1 domain-containing protein [Heracleum sosnowskyi]
MVSTSSSMFIHFVLLSCLIFISSAQTPIRPTGLILPVTTDPSTLQYTTQIQQRTPLVPVKLTLDLGGPFLWVDCDQGYTTSSYRPARCNSAQCSLAKSSSCMTECYSPAKPGCTNNTCTLFPENPITSSGTSGTLGSDVVSVRSAAGASVSVAQFLLKKKFGVCLSSTSSNGAIFLGEFDSSTAPLTYTPLLVNPVSTAGISTEGEASSDYFIGVKSININEKAIKIKASLLEINATDGYGGTKISTVKPYTILERSIYKAVVNAFVKELNVSKVASVAPFGACFNSKDIDTAYTGPAVPKIDLVMQNKDVYWRIFGGNSMISVSNDVMCLAFVDGGKNPRTSIVIGGRQVEENLLEFDIASSKLGFSPLLFRKQICANYNFAAASA